MFLRPNFAHNSEGGGKKPPEPEKGWDALATKLTAPLRKSAKSELSQAWQAFESRHHDDGKLPLNIMQPFKTASSRISGLSDRLERGGRQAFKTLIDARLAIRWLTQTRLTPDT